MVKAYYLENATEAVTLEHLHSLGVMYWQLDPANYEKDGKLDKICHDRGYTYKDFVNSNTIPNLKDKLAIFLKEHLHTDEEIRFILDGSGYFDVRDRKDVWIRIHVEKGDLITLPAGMYHRFMPDDNLFFYVMRLFVGEPVWTPYNREEVLTDKMDSRLKYVSEYCK